MVAEELLEEIKRVVKEETPFSELISGIDFEGPKVVLYCKDLDLLMKNGEIIKDLAKRIRKRIILRPDPSILTDPEHAEAEIRAMVPEDAGITNIIFSQDIGEVIIEAQKPGVVIGKGGNLLREIMRKVNWTPRVIRALPIKSDLVRDIRLSIIGAGVERRDTLHKIGRRIHRKATAKTEWVRLTTLGGSREVGRSCFLLQTPESKVFLDCGVSVSSADKPFPYLGVPEVRLPEIDAVILSHAHLDHMGLIPYLYKYGFEGPVYCTPPTRDLAVLLQRDYLDIAEKEGKPAPYGKRDIQSFVQHCIPLDYGDVTDVSPDIRITFHNAGHILGSAVTHIHIGEGVYNLVYTGDLKFGRTRLFSPAVYAFPRVETVIMDSTYGGKEDIQPFRQDAEQEFIRIVNDTIRRSGKVLVPVFAVGRSQEIMILLEEARREGMVEEVPIYLDGMIQEATAIHTAYPEYLCSDLRTQIFREGQNPFLSEAFVKVENQDQRVEAIDGPPCIILATSGMMNGGPIMEYFRALARDPLNSLIFVGYQGEGSLGRRIQKGWREIPLQGAKGKMEELKVNMEIYTVDGFSGHSDRNQLLNYIKRIPTRPERVICCHGDESKCIDLASTIHKLFNVETRAPLNLETIRLL